MVKFTDEELDGLQKLRAFLWVTGGWGEKARQGDLIKRMKQHLNNIEKRGQKMGW